MSVVDASVAAKWYLPEAGSDEASQLLRKSTSLFAPGLIRIEVTAAILRQFRNGHITETRALAAQEEWQRALADESVTLIPDDELIDDGVKLAMRLRHPFQDCIYLACANRLKVPLITADPKFHQRAEKHFGTVKLLAGCRAN
jgi:predicted nucleic acid-binding protein